MALIELADIRKDYIVGDVTITAVDNATFEVQEGELVVILGPSGAGKTTVLNLLGGMDSPTSGHIVVDGKDVAAMSAKELVQYRRGDIGFVFQFYNLIGNLTAKENVELATQICPDSLDPSETLTKVGLSHRINSFPAQLSGGEQQRVAIARAIAKNPKLLLCDEPTGALDSNTGKMIIELLQQMCKDLKTTTILITHNSAIASIADKVIHVRNGTVESIEINSCPLSAEEIEL